MSGGYKACFDDYCKTVRVLTRLSVGRATLAERAQAAIDEIERLQAEVNALRRWAKAAGNAYCDVMQSLVSETAAIQALHPEDWARAQSWATEICAAREAAEKVST